MIVMIGGGYMGIKHCLPCNWEILLIFHVDSLQAWCYRIRRLS